MISSMGSAVLRNLVRAHPGKAGGRANWDSNLRPLGLDLQPLGWKKELFGRAWGVKGTWVSRGLEPGTSELEVLWLGFLWV